MDKCEDLKEYLAAYADGELEGELRERVRRHLDECERCRSECAELKKVAELYRGSAPPEVGAGDWAKVSAALEASMVEEPPGGERLRWPRRSSSSRSRSRSRGHRHPARHPPYRWSPSKPTPTTRRWSVCP
ncbi:MAG: hypothetical protein AMK75_05480 [Planctomycetes bacterium SM23_65]|nr:MAG: hypothetical protein AMK75_05480 [Planctomycetes bacterium SM23_65]